MRTLLAVVLALWCGIVEAAVFNNSFTTNSPGKYFRPRPTTTSPLFPLMSLNPSGVGGDLDLQYSAGFFMSNNLAYFPVGATSGYVFTVDNAGKATWQPGIAAGSTGTVNTLPKWTSTNALGDSRVLDDGSLIVISPDTNAMDFSLLTNNTDLVAIGFGAFDQAAITNSTGIIANGILAMAGASVYDASDIFAAGQGTLQSSLMTNLTSSVTAIGANALKQSHLDGSFNVTALGANALQSSTLIGSGDIYAVGGSSLASSALTNSSDIYGIGNGINISGNSLSHMFVVGSGGSATNSNDWVAGDNQYNYFFPGLFATFGGAIKLSGTTNQLTDDGSTLLRNGVAIAGSETTATNVVTLTQTGTNILAMNFALVARGGVFKITLTNNAFMPTPSGVATSPFSKAWLITRQPSTGTCLITWSNANFAWPEGVVGVNDTNAGSVTIYEMISDVWTSGVVHVSMTPLSRLP